MGRAPCCDKVGLKKGPWTPEEDQILISFIQQYGHSNWRALPKQAGLLRCGKSCRLRWMNYLKPDIKRGNFTKEEEDLIIQLHQIMGNRWSAIASKLPGRTDNEIKNVWHTHLKKKFKQYQSTKPKPEMAANNDNNNYVTTTSNETTSAETSHQCVPTSPQQSYNTSDDFSTFNEVSSEQTSDNNIVTTNKDDDQISDTQHSDMDYFPIIDDTFWSYHSDGAHGVHSSFLSNGDDENQWQALTYDKNGEGNFGDNMDFWFDVFLTAGGSPELSGF